MAITNLTNTKWFFNPLIDVFVSGYPLGNKTVNFTGGGQSRTTLGANIANIDGNIIAVVVYDGAIVWREGLPWQHPENRRVIFNSGTDIADANLISWIQANATQRFDVLFYVDGGSEVSSISFVDVLPTLPSPTKQNYAFDGWYYDSGLTSVALAGDTITADIMLYAKWVFIGYEISFVTNGGTDVEKLTAQFDIPDSLPTSTKTNSLLVSWCYDEELSQRANSGDVLSDNITLYAKWYNSLGEFYKDLADAIRSKTGGVDPIKHVNFPDEVNAIEVRRPEESPTVALDFTDGDVTLTPQAGNVYSQVTLLKDETHIPENIKKGVVIYGVEGDLEGVSPSELVTSQSIFTGATIPLTYLNNTHDYENNYPYKSKTHNLTISGLEGRATITGNGTKDVMVSFDVTSSTSSLKNFTITAVNGSETSVYKGMHAHYGTNVTTLLSFIFNNISPDGSEGAIGTEYSFVVSVSSVIPYFSAETENGFGYYPYQLLNILLGNVPPNHTPLNYTLSWCYSFNQPLTIPSGFTSISNYFLGYCHSFNQPITIPSGVITIGANFIFACLSFNQAITIPSSVTSIGNNFLSNSRSFNQAITIPNSVTTIGNNFLSSCSGFNQAITIPSSVTSISSDFLSNCTAFNQPITIPSGITSINTNFLGYCSAFNQAITIPSGVTSIGSGFLFNCLSFNQPITIPSGITSIGNDFLNKCSAFNQVITILSSVTSIGNGFLIYCSAFNQPITIPNSVTTIGTNFLGYCSAFNQPLTIPSGVTTINESFLSNCTAFNQPITIPNSVTSINYYFIYKCSAFNQPITIPSGITSINSNFLAYCNAFNQPITIPSSVTSIGNYFLAYCNTFNQAITIPSSVTSIGVYVLHNCLSLSAIKYESSVYPTDTNSLSQVTNAKTSTNGKGIKVYGSKRLELMAALPNRTSSPYRKLIDGGY